MFIVQLQRDDGLDQLYESRLGIASDVQPAMMDDIWDDAPVSHREWDKMDTEYTTVRYHNPATPPA